MRRLPCGIALVCLLFAPCASAGEEPQAPELAPVREGLTRIISTAETDASLRGLKKEAVAFYDPANLYEYIDGQAEGFIAYDFRLLASATYMCGEDTVVLDVYDMGKPIQAFGLYSTFRAPSNEFVALGAQGFKAADGYMFWDARYAVKVAASHADEAAMYGAALAVARAADAAIKPDDSGLDLLKLLPDAGKLANSEKYVMRAVLGQSFLSNGVIASYPSGGDTARLFVCDCGDERAALAAYGEYLKFATAHGKPAEVEPGRRFRADVKYYGLTEVFAQGAFLAGGVSLPAQGQLVERLRASLELAAAR